MFVIGAVLTREGLSGFISVEVVDVAQTEPNSKTEQNEKAKKTGREKKKRYEKEPNKLY